MGDNFTCSHCKEIINTETKETKIEMEFKHFKRLTRNLLSTIKQKDISKNMIKLHAEEFYEFYLKKV